MLKGYEIRIAEDKQNYCGCENEKVYRAYWLGVYTGELQRMFFVESQITIDEYMEIMKMIENEYKELTR